MKYLQATFTQGVFNGNALNWEITFGKKTKKECTICTKKTDHIFYDGQWVCVNCYSILIEK